MLLTRYNPNTKMREFRRSFDLLNSMLDDMQDRKPLELKNDFTPHVNTREGEFAYHIEIDLPGVKKEDIDIKIENGGLLISGERKSKEEVKEENYYKVESSFGSFSRSFQIPKEIDAENIHAESTDGVLEVILPKLTIDKVDKVKKIEIK